MENNRYLLLLLIGFFILSGCRSGNKPESKSVNQSATSVPDASDDFFQEIGREIGLDFVHSIGDNDLTNIISSELKVNMTNINFNVREGIFEGTIDLFVHHTQDLNNLILKLSNVKGIDTISRVEDFS